MSTSTTTAQLRLDWYDVDGIIVYRLFLDQLDGQTRFLGSTEQGPFDTALEIAQWAWRLIAREVPPSSC